MPSTNHINHPFNACTHTEIDVDRCFAWWPVIVLCSRRSNNDNHRNQTNAFGLTLPLSKHSSGSAFCAIKNWSKYTRWAASFITACLWYFSAPFLSFYGKFQRFPARAICTFWHFGPFFAIALLLCTSRANDSSFINLITVAIEPLIETEYPLPLRRIDSGLYFVFILKYLLASCYVMDSMNEKSSTQVSRRFFGEDTVVLLVMLFLYQFDLHVHFSDRLICNDIKFGTNCMHCYELSLRFVTCSAFLSHFAALFRHCNVIELRAEFLLIFFSQREKVALLTRAYLHIARLRVRDI